VVLDDDCEINALTDALKN